GFAQSGAGRRRRGVAVSVLDGQAAAQHLQEHLAEHGAEVEEGVGHQVEPRIDPEIRQRPGRLRDSRRHQAPQLVRKPAERQRADDQTCRGRQHVNMATRQHGNQAT
uniref:Uncharacterized protein n=1 Tax=Poecilia latipinna TaxID=48699 RepID=A0A3B3UB28_9TELE